MLFRSVDSHDLGRVRVHRSVAEARADQREVERGADGVSFLKEQQWRIDFAMARVAPREFRESIPASSARIVPRSDGQIVITAPVTGRLVTAGDQAPRIGIDVERGQLLATIAPKPGGDVDLPTLRLDATRAQVEVDHARSTRERLEGLLASGAVAEKRMLEARRDEERSRAELSAARRRLAQFEKLQTDAVQGAGTVEVVTPITGSIVEVTAAPGALVEAGQALMRIIDLDRLWLEARVAESNLGRIDEIGGAWFEVSGSSERIEIGPDGLIASGGVVDERTRTAPFLFEVDNRDRRLRAGLSVGARIAVGSERRGLGIPASAIVREGHEEVCFVQRDGELFERRYLRTAERDRGWVLVERGVARGERVVTRGSFALKLAGSAGQVAGHGHVH